MNRDEVETLEHAARLLRVFEDVRGAYVSGGWLSVGMILSTIQDDEIREVADWVTTFAQDRDGPIRGARVETPRGTDGKHSSTEDSPPPPRDDSASVAPLTHSAAESTVPYDWETEGFGGT